MMVASLARAAGEPLQVMLKRLEQRLAPRAGGDGSDCEREEAREAGWASESHRQPCG